MTAVDSVHGLGTAARPDAEEGLALPATNQPSREPG